MEHKNIRLIVVIVLIFAILSTGCSLTVTKNIYNVKPKTLYKTDSTTYVLQLGSESPKSKDGQR